MEENTTTFTLSFYKTFIGVFAWITLIGIPGGTILLIFIEQEQLNIPTLITSNTIALILCFVLSFIYASVTVKNRKIKVSPIGLNVFSGRSKSNLTQWSSIHKVEPKSFPGFQGIRIITSGKNQKTKTYIPLHIRQAEWFRSCIMEFAGVENPLSQTLRDLKLTEPPILRVTPSQRQHRNRRLAIAIPMGLVFVIFAGFLWINGWFFGWEILNSFGLLENAVASVPEYCFNFSRWLMIWIVILWPIILLSCALTPPIMVFLSFKRKPIAVGMGLCTFAGIAFYVIGLTSLYLAC